MTKGISLNIGVNSLDTNHYESDGLLRGCENDARDMQTIANKQGFDTQLLLTEEATRGAVITAVRRAAFELVAGDIFLITYSGHGGRIPDRNRDEDDLLDETWCLYDAQLIDDQLKMLWRGFKAGVRIFVISDSCHSGTITKPALPIPEEITENAKFLPYDQAMKIYRAHREQYDTAQNTAQAESTDKSILASVRLLSGCQDNQYSYDGAENGAFTAVLKRVWNDGRFEGDYTWFHRSILAEMPPRQSPNHSTIGATNESFDTQKPFEI